MFHRCRDDVLLARGNERAVNRGIVTFSAATGENDFLRVSVDESSDFGASIFDMLVDLRPKLIGAGRISPEFSQKGLYRRRNFWRNACGGVVIEIIELPLTHI